MSLPSHRHHKTNDLDQFRQLIHSNGWQTTVSQLASGDIDLKLSLYSAPGVAGWRTSLSPPTVREMHTPDSGRTFGLIVPEKSGNRWCHETHDGPALLLMPRSDFVASTSGGLLGYQFSFEEHLLQESLEQMELPEDIDPAGRLLSIESDLARSIVDDLDVLWSERSNSPVGYDASDLLCMFLGRLVPRQRRYRCRSSQRRQAFHKAREYMHANLAEAITLADVCRNIGASRRSVTQAFQEALGVSPMSYLKIIRLNRAREELLIADASEMLVVTVANGYGFWHMGQFAKDYQGLFGELPSRTLAASSFLQ